MSVICSPIILMSNYDVKCTIKKKEKEFGELVREEIWNLDFEVKLDHIDKIERCIYIFVCCTKFHREFRYMVFIIIIIFSAHFKTNKSSIALTFFLLHFIKVAADFHCYCSQIISICIDKYDLYLVKLLLTS